MQLSNSYKSLGEDFFIAAQPRKATKPEVFLWNQALADSLGVVSLMESPQQVAEIFAGNQLLPNSQPVALAYAGHQFGQFSPRLGDGRAHLLGEITAPNGEVFDIQLKGSGATPFSRGGDGLCGMGPAIREFIMSEAMHALGVPTSRSLAVVTTGEQIYREGPVPGAVVTRVAASHIRVGTFEYFYSQGNQAAVEALCDFAIARHYPQLSEQTGEQKYLEFLKAVFARQITLVCEWLRVGFIHGVMNTDNTAISGETIDYGPCAMMSAYNPNTVYSSIDGMGRYRYGKQPAIAQWNMARLTECFLPLLHPEPEKATQLGEQLLVDFVKDLETAYHQMITGKAGLVTADAEAINLCNDFLQHLRKNALDYTNSYDRLTRSLQEPEQAAALQQELGDWYSQWQARLQSQELPTNEVAANMRAQNPSVIPRNHHMEAVIEESIATGSPDAAEAWLKVLRKPYEMQATTANFQNPPVDGDRNYQTFCGT